MGLAFALPGAIPLHLEFCFLAGIEMLGFLVWLEQRQQMDLLVVEHLSSHRSSSA